ncbi:MAG: Ig-like domain-containing protein, partial [bacterium]
MSIKNLIKEGSKMRKKLIKINFSWVLLLTMGLSFGLLEEVYAAPQLRQELRSGGKMYLKWDITNGATYTLKRAINSDPTYWDSSAAATVTTFCATYTDTIVIYDEETGGNGQNGAYYRYRLKEEGGGWSNMTLGYLDRDKPNSIADLIATSQAQQNSIQLQWTSPLDPPFNGQQTPNGSQLYYMIYRKAKAGKLENGEINNNNLLAVVKAINPHNNSALQQFTCYDANGTGTIRDVNWQYYSWVNPNMGVPDKATQYAYAVITVDTAGVWTTNTTTYYPLGTPGTPTGNVSEISGAGQATTDLKGIVSILDLTGVGTGSGGVGSITLNWSVATNTLGIGYYFEIHRKQLPGTLTQEFINTGNYLIGTTTDTSYEGSVTSGLWYSFAAIIVDPSDGIEKSPISNDLVILGDWTPPEVNITNVTPTYTESPGTITVSFTYTELNPDKYIINIYNDEMGINSIGSFTSTLTIPNDGTLTITGTVTIDGVDGTYSVKVTVIDEGDNEGESIRDSAVVVDTIAPTVSVNEPAVDVYRKNNGIVTVYFTYSEPNPVTYSLRIYQGAIEIGSDTGGLTIPDGSKTVDVQVSGATDGTYSVQIKVTDTLNHSGYGTATGLVVLDNKAPEVDVTEPSVDVYRENGGTVSVTFSYSELNPATYTITISGIGGTVGSAEGTLTIPDGQKTVDVQVSGADGTYSVSVTVTDKVNLSDSGTALGTVTLDNKAPEVNITSPLGGTIYTQTPATITVTFTYVEDNPATITVTIGTTTVIGSATGTPESAVVQILDGYGTASVYIPDPPTPANGTYNVKVVMSDRVGKTDEDEELGAVWVDNTVPGTITIVAVLTNGNEENITGTISVGGTVTIRATAQDDETGIDKVEFYWGDTLLDTSGTNSSPSKLGTHTIVWNTTGDGIKDLFCIAYDQAGNTATSPAIVTVVDNQPPQINIISPTTQDKVYQKAEGTVTVVFIYTEVYPATLTITINSLIHGELTSTQTTNLLAGTDARATYTLTFTGAANKEGTYTVSVWMSDKSIGSTTDTEEEAVIIDNTEPAMTIVYPTEDNLAYATNTDIVIVRFTYTEANPDIAVVYIGTSSYLFAGTNTNLPPGTGTTIGTVSLLFKNLPEGTYSMQGYMIDKCGVGTWTDVIWGVVVLDDTPPIVEITDPTTLNKAYKKGTDSVVVTFSFTEKYPGTLTISIEGTTFSTQTVYPSTSTPAQIPTIGSLTLPFEGLIDGAYSLFIELQDKVGKIGTNSQTDALIIDNILPEVTIINPLGSYTTTPDNRVVIFTYTEQNPDFATITITGVATETVFATTTTTFYGNWGQGTISIPAGSGTLDGTYTVEVTLTDKIGNKDTDTKDEALTIDDTAPAMTIVYPTENNLAYATGTDIIVPRFTYTEANPDIAVVYMGTSSYLFAGTNTNLPPGDGTTIGTVSLPFKDLPEGTYSVVGTMTDKCGLGTQTPVIWGVVVVDTTGPSVEITDPTTLNKAYKKGTDSVLVTFSFTEKYPGTLTIGIGTISTQILYSTFTTYPATITQYPPAYKGSLTLPFEGLAEGTYTLFIELTDKVGAMGTNSQADAVIIDDSGPVVTIINPLGSYTTTPVNRVVLFDYVDASPFVYATITISGIATTTVFSTVTMLEGRGMVTIPAGNGDLDGTYTVKVEAVDTPGNGGSKSEDSALTIDDTKPAMTIVYPTEYNLAYATGSDTIVPRFTYTEANPYGACVGIGTSTIIFRGLNFNLPPGDGTTIGTVSLPFKDLPEGTYSVVGTMTDKCGLGTQTPVIWGVVVVDTTGPIVEITDPTTLNKAYKKGTDSVVVEFSFTEKYPGTLTIGIGTISTQILYSTFTTYPATTTQYPPAYKGSLTLPFEGLAEGTYTLFIELTDKVGAIGTNSQADAVIIDDSAPVVTIINPLGSYTTTPVNRVVLFDYVDASPFAYATITISGIATTTVFSTVTTLKGRGTVSIPAGNGTLDGTYTVGVIAVDTPGNEGSASKESALTIDDTKPNVTLLYPTNGNPFYGKANGTFTITFSFTEENYGTSVVIISTFDGTVQTTVSTTVVEEIGMGSATFNYNSASEGTYSVKVEMIDIVNNLGTDTQREAIIIDTTDPVLNMISPATVTYTMETDTVEVIFTYTEIHPGTTTAELIGTSGATFASTFTTILAPTGTNTSLQGTLTLELESISDGTYSIRLTMLDKANNSTATTHPDAVIIVDTISPEVTIISPTTNSPAYGTGTGSIEVVFTYTEANSEIATVTIVGQGISTSTTNLVGGPGVHQGTVTLPFTGLSNGTYSLKIELRDIPGNVGSSTQQDALIIDGQPPIVTIISPTGYGTKTWACEGGQIEVVFSYTEQNPAMFTILVSSLSLGGIGTFTVVGGISGGTDCVRSEIVTLDSPVMPEGTYTLFITMIDMLGGIGFAATDSAVWIDTTNPETQGTGTDISSPDWGAMVPVEPGTISGVIGDGVTNPLWMSGVRKVVAYFIHAGRNIPSNSPPNYPYDSETDSAFLALNPIFIGSYTVSEIPAPALATYSINWDPTSFPPGGFWIVTFVYDEAGNVYDPWLPGGIRDVTPPEQIKDVLGKSPQGTTDVVLDWTHNWIPSDNSGSICGYRIYAVPDDGDPYNSPPAAPDKGAVANFVPSGTYTVWRYNVNATGRWWFWIAAVDEEIIYDGGDSVIETYPQIGYDDTFVASGTGSQPGATYTTIIEPGLNKYINSIPGDIDGDGEVEYPGTDDRGPNIALLSPPVLVYINDLIAPPVVTQFNATTTTNSRVLLQGTQTTKNKNIDNDMMDYYLVYRKTQGTNLLDGDLIPANQIAEVDYDPVNITEDLPGTYTYHFQYTDSAVTVGKTYAYAVIAVDRTGNKSAISIGVNTVVTVLDTTPPDAINTLAAQPIAGSRTVKLTWLEPTDNVGVTLYTIYRATSPIYATSTADVRGTTTTPGYDDIGSPSDEGKTFYYAVIAKDGAGNESNVSNSPSATVNDVTAPTPVFGYNPSSPKQDEVVTFDASGSNDNIGVVSYYWGFGDGATATGMVVNHSYANIGTYTVTLMVRDEAGNSSSTSQDVVVGDSQKPVISGLANRKGNTGDMVSVPVTVTDNNEVATVTVRYSQDGNNYSTSTVGSGKNWNWTFTFTATDTSVSDIEYQVEASDYDGNTSVSGKWYIKITDDENPVAAFGYTPNLPKQDEVVTFDASGSNDNIGVVSYYWGFGDGATATGMVVNHSY